MYFRLYITKGGSKILELPKPLLVHGLTPLINNCNLKTMKRGLIKTIQIVTIVGLFIIPIATHAQYIQNGFDIASNIGGDEIGTTDLRDVIINLVNVLLGFLGIIFIIIILWGGFQWMFSGGNDESVSSARSTLISGFIGIAIIITAFSIAQFVINALSGATGGSLIF